MRAYSYEGIGQWAATFACEEVRAGQVVKVSGDGTVSGCGAGERFAGVALSVGRDGAACAVALGGMATAAYSGETAPKAGWCALTADGQGGVTAAEGAAGGREYLVAEVDTAAKTETFVL